MTPPLDPQDVFLSKLNQEQYLKELESLMEKRREIANDPTAKMSAIPYPYGHHPLTDRIKLYQDRAKRLKEKTCSRCGYQYEYHIEHKQVTMKLHDIGETDTKFYQMVYEIARKTVPNPGKLDNSSDVCISCQNDILGKTNAFQRDINLKQTKMMIEDLRDEEQIRYNNQQKLISKLQKKYYAEQAIRDKQRRDDAEARAIQREKDAIANVKEKELYLKAQEKQEAGK